MTNYTVFGFKAITYNGLLSKLGDKPLCDGRRYSQPKGKSYTLSEMYEINKKVYDELHPMILNKEITGREFNPKMHELYNKYS